MSCSGSIGLQKNCLLWPGSPVRFLLMADQSKFPEKIVLEVVSPEVVSRLEARDDELRAEISRLDSKLEGLHRTIYELLETIGTIRSKR